MFTVIIETEMLAVHILFFLIANSNPESADQVSYTVKLMYLILALLATFTIIAIVQAIMFVYEWLTKKKEKNSNQVEELDYNNEKVK